MKMNEIIGMRETTSRYMAAGGPGSGRHPGDAIAKAKKSTDDAEAKSAIADHTNKKQDHESAAWAHEVAHQHNNAAADAALAEGNSSDWAQHRNQAMNHLAQARHHLSTFIKSPMFDNSTRGKAQRPHNFKIDDVMEPASTPKAAPVQSKPHNFKIDDTL